MALSETPRGSLGLIIANDQAVAAGAASIPAPGTNTDAPFYVYEPWISAQRVSTAVGFVSPAGYSKDVDSKGMRKAGANDDSAIMISENQGLGADVQIQGRMLVKLH